MPEPSVWLCLAAATLGAAAATWALLGPLPAGLFVAVVLLLSVLMRR